jgi:hypothetical protein
VAIELQRRLNMTTTALATNHKGKGGPKTEAGRKAVALNAAKHGAMSLAPVIPGLEAAEDWEAHRAGVVDSLSPEGRLEEVLAERAALLLWRLLRVARYETEMASLAYADAERDTARKGYGDDWLRWPEDVRAEAETTSKVAQAFIALLDAPDDAPVDAAAASGIVYAVWEEASAEIVDDDLDLPGVPGDVYLDDLGAWDGWTAGTVRACIAAVAAVAGDDPETLRRNAMMATAKRSGALRAEAEKLERKLVGLRAERILADAPTLEKVMRYEAHLGRQLTSTLHELEALQKRREGEPTPMARLDVAVGT